MAHKPEERLYRSGKTEIQASSQGSPGGAEERVQMSTRTH